MRGRCPGSFESWRCHTGGPHLTACRRDKAGGELKALGLQGRKRARRNFSWHLHLGYFDPHDPIDVRRIMKISHALRPPAARFVVSMHPASGSDAV